MSTHMSTTYTCQHKYTYQHMHVNHMHVKHIHVNTHVNHIHMSTQVYIPTHACQPHACQTHACQHTCQPHTHVNTSIHIPTHACQPHACQTHACQTHTCQQSINTCQHIIIHINTHTYTCTYTCTFHVLACSYTKPMYIMYMYSCSACR